jgi:MFS family permease
MIEHVPHVHAAPNARLWHNRDFNIFWIGQALSGLGDAFALVALPLLVLQTTGSVAQMGLVTGASGIGQLLAGLIAGPLVDRLDRRKLMIVCDIGRMLLFATIPLAWWSGGPQIWLLYATAMLGAALGMGFSVAYITAVANLVDREQLIHANARLQATFALATVVGPVLAGVISVRFGPAAAIGIDALSFLASALSLMLIRLRPSSDTRSLAQHPVRQATWDELIAGIRFLLREPVLRSVTLMFFTFMLAAAGGYNLFIYYLKHDLGQPDSVVGIVFGVAGSGALLGALLAPILRRHLGFGICFLGSMMLEGIAIILIGLASTVALMAVLAMGMIFASTIKVINSISLRQQITPDHLLGRVTAAFWTLLQIPQPIGAAMAAGLGAWLGVPLVIMLMGVVGLAIGLVGLLTPARTRWPEAQAEQRVLGLAVG